MSEHGLPTQLPLRCSVVVEKRCRTAFETLFPCLERRLKRRNAKFRRFKERLKHRNATGFGVLGASAVCRSLESQKLATAGDQAADTVAPAAEEAAAAVRIQSILRGRASRKCAPREREWLAKCAPRSTLRQGVGKR